MFSAQVVLSTNIAEASVTIDDVVYVIDTGVRKERSYDAGGDRRHPTAVEVLKFSVSQGFSGNAIQGELCYVLICFKYVLNVSEVIATYCNFCEAWMFWKINFDLKSNSTNSTATLGTGISSLDAKMVTKAGA